MVRKKYKDFLKVLSAILICNEVKDKLKKSAYSFSSVEEPLQKIGNIVSTNEQFINEETARYINCSNLIKN